MHQLLNEQLSTNVSELLDGFPGATYEAFQGMVIYDDFNNSDVGYGFLSDNRNGFQELFKKYAGIHALVIPCKHVRRQEI